MDGKMEGRRERKAGRNEGREGRQKNGTHPTPYQANTKQGVVDNPWEGSHHRGSHSTMSQMLASPPGLLLLAHGAPPAAILEDRQLALQQGIRSPPHPPPQGSESG